MGKFSNECDYLIHLLRCAIHDLQPAELPEELEFDRVYEWGKYHHVANIAFYSVEKLENKPGPELYRKWQTCRDQAIVRDITQSYAAMEIRNALHSAGIRMREVQGTEIKPLYPHPEWRTMSDLDFIVDPDRLSDAQTILEGLGYACYQIDGVEVHGRRPPNINVELHTEYFSEKSEYRKVMHSPFASPDEEGQHCLNELYLYNILHIAKHYFSGGCGIRRVLDVYYLNKHYGQTIDRTCVQQALEQASIADFAAKLDGIANAWFLEGEQNLPESAMERYIVNSGLHGHWLHAEENGLGGHLNKADRFTKPKYLLRRLLGTGVLRTRYPVLERYKILYPVCWLHRVFCALGSGERKRIKKEVKLLADAEIRK